MIIDIPDHPNFCFEEVDWLDNYYKLYYTGPLPQTTTDAFAISIEKQQCMIWVNNELPDAIGFDCGGVETCGLCMRYAVKEQYEDGYYEMDCTFCPVFSITGKHGCADTPWMNSDWKGELEFLVDLRDQKLAEEKWTSQ